MAAAYLLIVKYFIVLYIDQTKMATHADQSTIFEGKHGVIPGIAIANSVDFGLYFGWMYGDAMDGCVLLHLYLMICLL